MLNLFILEISVNIELEFRPTVLLKAFDFRTEIALECGGE